jgi:serine phosphatase RsbU (regulator of sigma subunit)
MLAPTGPVIGVGGLAFAAARTPLPNGDMLVLATDGVTEARDPQGRFIPIDSVTAWIAAADASTPQALVDRLLEAVMRFTRGRIADDLAILAVEPLP